MIKMNSVFSDIVESKSNSSSNYIKFANGILIQYGEVYLTPTANTHTLHTINFPLTFLELKYAVCQPYTSVPENLASAINKRTTTDLEISFYRKDNVQTGFGWFAIGIWK